MIGLLGEVDLPAPIGDRWFEDYVPGVRLRVRLRQSERDGDRRVRAGLRPAVDPHRPGLVGGGTVRRVDRQRCAYDRRLHASLRRPLHLPRGQSGLARPR